MNADATDFEASLAAKSDQINNTDLVSGAMTITITKLGINNAEAQKWNMTLAETDKFYRPCLGMRRVIAALWGKPPYTGRKLTIYRDPDVRYGAETPGGIRISHMSHIDGNKTMTVPVSRGKVKEYTIRPLAAEVVTLPQAEPDNALELAQAAARKGKAAFAAWWKSDEGRACRKTAEANIEDLKAMVDAADATDDDGPPM